MAVYFCRAEQSSFPSSGTRIYIQQNNNHRTEIDKESRDFQMINNFYGKFMSREKNMRILLPPGFPAETLNICEGGRSGWPRAQDPNLFLKS